MSIMIALLLMGATAPIDPPTPGPRFLFNMEISISKEALAPLCADVARAKPDHAKQFERLRNTPHDRTTYEMAELAALATLDQLLAQSCSGRGEDNVPDEKPAPIPVA